MLTISEKQIEDFKNYLIFEERGKNTIDKYVRDIKRLREYIDNKPLDKLILLEYKKHLCVLYKPASVNTMIAAINKFLEHTGRIDIKIKPLKIQRAAFCQMEKEINYYDYEKLICAARNNGEKQLMLIIETIASTGIRISELKFITVEAIRKGVAQINCKGKHRIVLLPTQLCDMLNEYVKIKQIHSGSVFISKNGNPLDRSNIAKKMKKIAVLANVEQKKVFPHNLRHFFARSYYSKEKDIVRLADILGHTNINTTRIYTVESGYEHLRQLNRLNLVITT